MSDLSVTRDHCRRMAEQHPEEPLWRQLADEIDAYLEPAPEQTEELFRL